MAEKFAREAILAQPVSYLHVVVNDTLHTFGWNRQPDPNNYYGNGPAFQFVSGKDTERADPLVGEPRTAGDAAARQDLPGAAGASAGRGSGRRRRCSPGSTCSRCTSGTSTCAAPCSA